MKEATMRRTTKSAASEIALMARRADRERRMAALADGRKVRSVKFTDRKKENARRQCRGKVTVSCECFQGTSRNN